MKICKNFTHWLEVKPYTKAAIITAVAATISAAATIVMAITSGIMLKSLELTAKSLEQNEESLEMTRTALGQTETSLKLTAESLELQRKEFKLRNRPFVIVMNKRFSGEARDDEGKLFSHSVCSDLVNISEVPANQVSCSCRAYLNGREVWCTIIPPMALANAGSSKMTLFLKEDIYAAATNVNNRFEVVEDVTYSGMLGEDPKEYRTFQKSFYSLPEGIFKYAENEYR